MSRSSLPPYSLQEQESVATLATANHLWRSGRKGITAAEDNGDIQRKATGCLEQILTLKTEKQKSSRLNGYIPRYDKNREYATI